MKSETAWIVVGSGCLLLLVVGFFGTIAAGYHALTTGDELGLPMAPTVSPRRAPVAPPATVPPTAVPDPAPPVGIGTAPEPSTRIVRATVTESVGLPDVPVGSECTLEVTHPDEMCQAQIACGPRHVYGSETQGFFPCSLTVGGARPDVQGTDTLTTSGDNDPAMTLDTALGTLSLLDDETGALGAFRLSAHVETVTYRAP
ncbi:MAG: hypothetical protein U0353_08755 [Sandaracinus sp.]